MAKLFVEKMNGSAEEVAKAKGSRQQCAQSSILLNPRTLSILAVGDAFESCSRRTKKKRGAEPIIVNGDASGFGIIDYQYR